MPTTNKRINLTVPEHLYKRIEAYKTKNGISSDAAACLQLIVRQLDGIDSTEQMLQMVNRFTTEELVEISKLGIQDFKKLTEKNQV